MSGTEISINSFTKRLRTINFLHPIFDIFFSPAILMKNNFKKYYKGNINSAKILNIGSGGKKINCAINIDIDKICKPDIVADTQLLPVKDNCIDLIICQGVITHLPDINTWKNEFTRVLKKGGNIYIETSFLEPFTPYPKDYYRFTIPCLHEILKPEYNVLKDGVIWGPNSSFFWMLKDYLSTMLSFNSLKLYIFLSIVLGFFFFPFKFLDYIFGNKICKYSHYYGLFFIYAEKIGNA